MRAALHWCVVVALSVSALTVWVAASTQRAHEPQRLEPAAVAAPYESPYPSPRVDPSAPPQEPAPTF